MLPEGVAPPPSGGSTEREGPTAATRERRQIVGGYAVDPIWRQTSGSLAGGGTYETVWEPYRNGDLRRILGRLVNQGAVQDLQLTLMQVGLLDRDAGIGIIDDATTDAFSALLTIANQNGLDWRDVLSQMPRDGSGGQGVLGTSGGSRLQPTVIQLPNRDDAIASARDAAMSLGGVAADDDLAEAMADSILDALRTQQERQVQAELAATASGQGPESVVFTEGNPDPARLLEEEYRRREPDLVAAKGARDLAELWFENMGGPV